MTLHRCCQFEGVDDDLLIKTLNTWVEGTIGYNKETLMIRILNALCREYGYGAVPEMAARIEDIWRYPEKVEQYAKEMAERREFLRRGLEKGANDV